MCSSRLSGLRRRCLAVLACLALAATSMGVHGTIAAASTPSLTLTRWQGPDRSGTAVALAEGAYPSGAVNAVVASGESYPDALSASYLAGYLHAPILLTPARSLSGETAAALRALRV